MKTYLVIALTFLVSQNAAWAKLGEKSAASASDKVLVSASKLSSDERSSCYTIKNIDSAGRHIREYVNKETDVVFMVATVSRLKFDTSALMGDDNLNEFKSAVKNTSSIKRSRNFAAAVTETPRLKVRSSAANSVFRTTMILKSATPACAGNPESLL